MFDVVPELDPESHHPPCVGNSGKALSEHPNADEHHQGVAVVQRFCLDQPGIPQTEQAESFRARPSHHINLVSLKQVLAPMRKHDQHENLQSTLVPAGVELLVKAQITVLRAMNIRNRWIRDRHYCPPSPNRQTHFKV